MHLGLGLQLGNHRNRNVAMSDVKYLFIDGSYLKKALDCISNKFFNNEEITIAPERLAAGYQKSFYYDCLPTQRKDEELNDYEARLQKQKEYFQALRSHPGMHVVQGVVRGRMARQKQVDVALTVDMLTHSYRRNMSRVTFIRRSGF